jgi:hypothetical protein
MTISNHMRRAACQEKTNARARNSAVSSRISLSVNGSGAATDEAPLQASERGLLQQDQCMADIVAIRVRMGGNHFFDAGRQPKYPAAGLRGAGW